VGDSFTAGADVAEHESYVAQLEAMLNYPVINGGVGGYGTDQMILAAATSDGHSRRVHAHGPRSRNHQSHLGKEILPDGR
jgi:hypothetical protein